MYRVAFSESEKNSKAVTKEKRSAPNKYDGKQKKKSHQNE